MKRVLKILTIILISIISIFLIDYLVLNIHYLANKKTYKETFNIQGNKNNYVPQGLTYSEKYNVMLQTSYNSKNKPSKLYVIDFDNGKLIKELTLLDEKGNDSYSHVGGLTCDDNNVYITGDYEINIYNLEEIIDTKDNKIKSNSTKKTTTKGDFCYYKNNILWIGDFCLSPFYKVPNNNPLIMGYDISKNIDYDKPNYVISLPKMVQGMAITDDNKFIFSRSFTNFFNSKLSIYNNILTETKDYYEINGNKIPYYKFRNKDLYKEKTLPPMSEGIFIKDDYLYISFENSSNKYFFSLPKLKKVIKYKY